MSARKNLFAVGLGTAATLVTSAALACGGGFGPGVSVDPAQTLVVAHKAGTETYVFRPHFCGEAKQFGLILPVPAALSASPKLGNPALFDELTKLSAPKVEKQKICKDSKGGPLAGGSDGTDAGQSNGANVVDQGQVGIFDWSLVKADTKESFTQWLDANGFAHAPTADEQFAHYVQQGWYFVAFKVTASPNDPPAGKKLCGDFGPIELGFPTASPVVPTRIAQVSAGGRSPNWRVYGISEAASQLAVKADRYASITSFSDELNAPTLAANPELAKLASAGDRVVRLEVSFGFGNLDKDLLLGTETPKQFRSTTTEVEYIDCPSTQPTNPPSTSGGTTEPTAEPSNGSSSSSGCNTTSRSPADLALGGLGVAIAIGLVARRRRR